MKKNKIIPAALLTGAGALFTLYELFYHFGIKSPKANSNIDLSDKVCLITGSSGGIGKETALALAKMGATIIFANRSKERTEEAIKYVRENSGNDKLYFLHLDLSDLDQVVQSAIEFKKMGFPLHILINNAGIFTPLQDAGIGFKNFEKMFVVNHLGHFLFTHLLLDELLKTNGRIVNVSSRGHKHARIKGDMLDMEKHAKFVPKNGREIFMQYGFTKLCNIWHIRELHERYGKYIIANAVHPGAVKTGIIKDQSLTIKLFVGTLLFLFGVDAKNGAQTTIYAATCPEIKKGGDYYSRCKKSRVSKLAENREMQKKMFQWCMEQIEPYILKFEKLRSE